MSMRPHLDRAFVLSQLRSKRSLPIRLGAPNAIAELCFQEGRFRLRKLGVEQAEIDRARTAAFAAGRSFMPEHVQDLLKPTGKIVLDFATFEELRAAIEAMPWPSDW